MSGSTDTDKIMLGDKEAGGFSQHDIVASVATKTERIAVLVHQLHWDRARKWSVSSLV